MEILIFGSYFRKDKGTRSQGGGDAPITGNKTNCLQVNGTNITEEVLRRRLASFEPFSFIQEPDDDK